jgi:hypothetical protein
VREKFVHLARPYVIWSVVQVSAEMVFSGHAFQTVDWQTLLAVPIIPHEQYWFLYALLCAYLVYAGARAVRLPFAGLAVLSAGLFVFPVHTEIAALDYFSGMLPFFLAGLALRGRFLHAAAGCLPEGRPRGVRAAVRDAGLASRRLKAPAALLRSTRAVPLWLAVSLTAAVVTAALLGVGALVFTRFVPPIRFTEHANYAAHEVAFLTLASLGLAACVAWAFALARAQAAGIRGVGVLSFIRRYSMPIYLMHMLVAVPVRIALLRGADLHSPALLVATGVVAAIWVPIVAYRLCGAYGLGWLFE